ncbi:hypothetical protein OHA57_39410 (plasmid) [Streptomyces anulatus]|uniref:hypothetical protein n=1 Tax=Streptomyces TaxID=1883 RepID=UPI0015CF18A2|nr:MULTISPECIES: hypothetical protein [Streptomyces]WSC66831.1 hypothetical protein OHA57_39410 [Streptomyces anulatus]
MVLRSGLRPQIDELIVIDPRAVLAHARTAAHADPDALVVLELTDAPEQDR